MKIYIIIKFFFDVFGFFIDIIVNIIGVCKPNRIEVIDSSTIINEQDNVKPVKFKLSGSQKIRRAAGHADMLFGVSGKNIYRYKGEIEINDKKFSIIIQMQPILIVEIDTQFYLLARSYFIKDYFQWYRPTNFQFDKPLPCTNIIPELFKIEFIDDNETSIYKFWILLDLLKLRPQRTLQVFKDYIADNPRFVYQSKSRAFHEFSNKLMEISNNKIKKQIFNYYTVILNHSMPQDSPFDIERVCYVLLDVDFKQARTIIAEYIQNVKKANIIDDQRLQLGTINRMIEISYILEKTTFKQFKKLCESSGYSYEEYHPDGVNSEDDPALGGLYYKKNFEEANDNDFYVMLMNNNDKEPYIEIKLSISFYGYETLLGDDEPIKISLSFKDTQACLDESKIPEFYFEELKKIYFEKKAVSDQRPLAEGWTRNKDVK